MTMYTKVKLYHIYNNLRYEDQHFQLGEHSYYAYEDAILRTMTKLSERALDMENSRYKKEFEKIAESDSDFSNDGSSDKSMSEQEKYYMICEDILAQLVDEQKIWRKIRFVSRKKLSVI